MHIEDGVIPFPDAKTSDDVFCIFAFSDSNPGAAKPDVADGVARVGRSAGMAVILFEGPKKCLFIPSEFNPELLNEIVSKNDLEDVKRVRFLDRIDANDKMRAMYASMSEEDKEWHRTEHKRRINKLRAYAIKIKEARKNKN